MGKVLIIGFVIITFNVIIQALGTVLWIKKVRLFKGKWRKYLTNKGVLLLLITSSLYLTLLHIVHAFIWAFCIYLMPESHIDFANFFDIFYYSLVTFTTLGYGDLTISTDWKLLSGIEAINGIMLIGWSTALMYTLIQNIFKTLTAKDDK